MKAFYFLLIALFVYQCYSTPCVAVSNPTEKKNCNDAEVPSGYHKCCYAVAKKGSEEQKACMPVKKEEYDDISKYIDNTKKAQSLDKLDVDCSSKYLVISILSLLLFLF